MTDITTAEALKMIDDDGVPSENIDKFLDVVSKPEKPWLIENAPIIGSIAGGMMGGVSPLPGGYGAGTATGAAIGSGLGTFLGSLIGQSGEKIYENVVQKEPQSASGNITGMLGEAGQEAGIDLAMSGTVGAVKKGYRALNPKTPPLLEEGAAEAQRLLSTKGARLTPGQILKDRGEGTLEGTLQGTIGGGKVLNKIYRSADEALGAIRDDILTSANKMTRKQRGELILDTLNGGNKALDDISEVLYKNLDKKITKGVNYSPVKDAARDILNKYAGIGNVGLSDDAGNIVKQIATDKLNVKSFSDMRFLRSQLLAESRRLKGKDDGVARRIIGDFVDKIDDTMEQSAKGTDAYDEYRKVSNFYRKSVSKLNDDVVLGLARKQPEDIGDALYIAGTVSEINKTKIALKRALSLQKAKGGGLNFGAVDKEYQDIIGKVREGYIQQLLHSKGALNVEGGTSGDALFKSLKDVKTRETMNALLDPTQVKTLENFAEASRLAQKRPDSIAPIFAQILQAGGLASGVTGIVAGDTETKALSALGLGAVLGGPKLIAKIITRPKIANQLLTVNNLHRAGRKAEIVASMSAKVLNDIQKEVKEEEKKYTEADVQELMKKQDK